MGSVVTLHPIGGLLTQVAYYLTSDWRMVTGSVLTLYPIGGLLTCVTSCCVTPN